MKRRAQQSLSVSSLQISESDSVVLVKVSVSQQTVVSSHGYCCVQKKTPRMESTACSCSCKMANGSCVPPAAHCGPQSPQSPPCMSPLSPCPQRCSSTSSRRDSKEIMNVFNVDKHVTDDDELPGKVEWSIDAPGPRHPAVFRWSGEGKTVSIAGSFNHWRTKIPLVKSESEFYTVVDVPEGTHQYKYYVDGKWVCHPNEPKVENGMGSQNNIITIRSSDCDIYEVLQSDGLGGGAIVDPCSSPPGTYSQYIPARDASLGFHRVAPPMMPPQLLETILNKEMPAHCEPTMVPEPNHVVLNHLYTLSIKGGVMVLSSTFRYRKKYITTLLYKPI